MNIYHILAVGVLGIHLLFILWVVFGALVARRRALWRWLHIASVLWGVGIELSPWPCPLTLLENWLKVRAGLQPYREGFLVHYLEAVVYPDIPLLALTVGAVAVGLINLGIYARLLLARRRH